VGDILLPPLQGRAGIHRSFPPALIRCSEYLSTTTTSRVDFYRTIYPADIGLEEECVMCGQAFEWGTVYAQLLAGGRHDGGRLCTSCVAFMGRHPSGRFPTIEEYRRLEAEWPTAEFTAVEEALAADEEAAWASRGN